MPEQAQGAPATGTPGIEQLAPDLHVLGGVIPSDQKVSWCAPRPGEFQPINCYLLQAGGQNLLIDTGVAAHEATVLGQLESLMPSGSSISVYLTRAELECFSNLGAIAERYVVAQLLTGGVLNPFDAFDGIRAQQYHRNRVQFDAGELRGAPIIRLRQVEIPERQLEVVSARLRLLPAFWLFDPGSGTLFTSDSFGHCTLRSRTESRILTESETDTTDFETVASQLLTKFTWLRDAKTEAIRNDVAQIFERLKPEMVAPTHGRILAGRSVVNRHLSLVLEVLDRCGRGEMRL
jgi:flavorubredoxin